MHIKIIGLGGIGNFVTTYLSLYLTFAYPESTLTLIDGKAFRPANKARQVFERFQNKAEETCRYMSQRFARLNFAFRDEYVDLDNISGLIYNGDIVFLCVDNHPSRKLVSDHGENLSDIVIFSGGNEETTGMVQIFIRKEGKNVTLPLANKFHPEIVNPQDTHPLAADCMEVLTETPQTLFANLTAGIIMLNAFFVYLQAMKMPVGCYFDICTLTCRPIHRKDNP